MSTGGACWLKLTWANSFLLICRSRIRSSALSRVTTRYRMTVSVCLGRQSRPKACRSCAGLCVGWKMMARFAPMRVIPVPPALVDTQSTQRRLAGSLNAARSFLSPAEPLYTACRPVKSESFLSSNAASACMYCLIGSVSEAKSTIFSPDHSSSRLMTARTIDRQSASLGERFSARIAGELAMLACGSAAVPRRAGSVAIKCCR
mmetsp:Transcript_10859/g.28459  ORF Transcript_10859/g.28459 Transcript_10859/m.28459 type:complete len:204 (+) Transcript_10859:251-862(+)